MQFTDASVAENRERVSEERAQLLDRHRLNVVLLEVRLRQFGERQ